MKLQLFRRPSFRTFLKYFTTLLPVMMFLALIPTGYIYAQSTSLTRTEFYTQVWNSCFWIWLGISFFGSLIASAFAASVNMGCGALSFVILFVVIGLGGAFLNATPTATRAAQEDWDAAVTEKATYTEKLLGVFIRADRIEHPRDNPGSTTSRCVYNDTDLYIGAEAATGCRNVTETSYCAHYSETTDEDGNVTRTCDDTDYEWYPWFNYEVSLTADLNVYEDSHLIFADHCAPSDWQNQIQYLPRGYQPGSHFCVAVSPDWDLVKYSVDRRIPLPGVVYHNTLNYVNADEGTIFRGSTVNVPKYEQIGLLPKILRLTTLSGEEYFRDIYGNVTGPVGYQYSIIQTLGTLELDSALEKELQDRASLWNATAGPKLKVNMMINLAYDREVIDYTEWMATTKADMMDNVKHGKEALAMNMSMWNCGVSDDGTTIVRCVMDTGTFQDNVVLKENIKRLQPFALTPDSLFGVMSANMIDDPEKPGYLKPVITFTGGVINVTMFDPDHCTDDGQPKIAGGSCNRFYKTPKAEYADKRYGISPDDDQLDRIKAAKGAETFRTIGLIMFVLVVGIIGGVSKMNE